MIWRRLYTLAWWLALPLAFAYLWRRSLRQPDYRLHWGERLGRYPARPAGPLIWLHAVSVGETRAAQPVVEALLARFPDHRLVLTQMTPTGRDTARQLFGERLAGRVTIAYLPYDLPFAVQRFLRHFQPRFGVLMELELWPNLLHGAAAAGMPVYLINARLSERTADGYRRVARLLRPALATLAGVAAQTADDAARLAALGTPVPVVTGNLKFDFSPDAAMVALGQHWRSRIGPRPVWVAASTREGEEALLLDALDRQGWPERALLLLVPRHPQRFDEVAALLTARGVPFLRRSQWGGAVTLPHDTRVLLIDSMGEVTACYTAADLAFVGGSLLDFGCHNVIEPCALGLPVLVGPSSFNFAEAVREAVAAGAARQLPDADALVTTLRQLLADDRARLAMRQAGWQVVVAHRGAVQRTLALLPAAAAPARQG